MAVRVALGETQLVQEVRRFLLDNGVCLDSFSQVGALGGGGLTSRDVGTSWRVGSVKDVDFATVN